MLSLIERRLVYPVPPLHSGDWNPTDLDFEDIELRVSDGARLHGWYVPHPNPRAQVLYCHGNGEQVPFLKNRLKVLHERSSLAVFAWDYRGYGKSEGLPHERNIVPDAAEALHWVARRGGVDPSEVIVIGRSLGGAVGTALAGQEPIGGLVLDRTFAKLTDAAAYHFPWLPVRRLMQNRFASIDSIQRYHGPLLQSHGTEDEVVPIAMGRELFEAAPSREKRFIEVPGLDHCEALPEYCYQALDDFITQCGAARRNGAAG